MQIALLLGLFLPLAGFLILTLFSEKINRFFTGLIACGTIFLSFVIFISLLYIYHSNHLNPLSFTLYQWVHVPGIAADFMLRLDPLSLVMTLVITGVGFLIHVYANGYMEDDDGFVRFFAFMNFFIFAMLLLVLAGDLLLLFVGWEGVGLASYLLIGFWYQRVSAAQAATKAFVVNRIADLGFLLGLLLVFSLFGTSNIAVISQKAQQGFPIGSPVIILLTFLLFIGAIGKSAQLPFYTWLPDAMEGPTPVSALIHAATMVTAGVYLVVRMHAVFMLAPITLHTVGIIGGVTSLFAAICAVGQTDLKRVLAYSTISQLGLMFLACGIGAFYAAMFHLINHAFMKALLFLSAGNVVHIMHTNEMENMGGLWKKFNKTHWFFLIGVLAMSGVPPLAAFFSKDLILEQEYLSGYEVLYFVGLAASALTAFYLTRAYILTFTGTPRLDEASLKKIHEAPPVMLIPVAILAFLSIFGGFLGFAFGKVSSLESFLAEVGVTLSEKEISPFSFDPESLLAIGVGLLGIGSAVFIYTKFADYPLPLLKNSFYVNEIYNTLFVRPLEWLSRLIGRVVEPKLFDGMIHAAVNATQDGARTLQNMQSGQIRSYVAWMVVGTVLLIVYFAF